MLNDAKYIYASEFRMENLLVNYFEGICVAWNYLKSLNVSSQVTSDRLCINAKLSKIY